MKLCRICSDGECSEKSRTGVCTPCQASFSYWKKKRPAQVVIRRSRLAKYTTRLDTWFDDKGKREAPKNGSGKKGLTAHRPRHATVN